MHLPEVAPVEMRVDLRRLDGTMSEDLLHDTEIAAPLEQVRGAGVAEGVGGNRAIDPGRLRVSLEKLPVPHPGERAPEACQEDRALAAVLREEGPRAVHVARERGLRLLPE